MSNIDVTKPTPVDPTTQSVRANFQIIKNEIEALQSFQSGGPFLPLTGGTLTGPITVPNITTTGPLYLNSAKTKYIEYTTTGNPRMRYMASTTIEGFFNDDNGLFGMPGGYLIRAATVAALRLIPINTLTINAVAIVDSYATPGDGGGGIFDLLTGLVATAPAAVTTNGSTTITGIPAGTLLFFGQGVAGAGIASNATIASIVSPTSITISAAATADAPGGTPISFYLQDDSFMCFKPSAVTTQQPSRWVRRINGGVVTLEMAGGKGDYVFPAAGVGEVMGTDNATAFTRIFNGTGSLAFSQGNQTCGANIQLANKRYRVSSLAPSSNIRIVGVGAITPNTLVPGNTGPNLFSSGSVIALEPTGSINPINGADISNVKIIRRGLDLNPTYDQVIAWNATMAQELAFNKHWVGDHDYLAGDICMNLGRVFYCDTGGRSGAQNTGGPEEYTTAVNSITDGSAKWHFLNQYDWVPSCNYVAGTMCCNNQRIYYCDTGGKSSASVNGPVAVTTGVNSITDGTVKWHYLGSFSTGIAGSNPFCTYSRLIIVGFAKGMCLTRSANTAEDIFMDCFYGLDARQAGDMVLYKRVHCVSLYYPTNGTVPDFAWSFKNGVGIFVHDRMDGVKLINCEAERWQVGIEASNFQMGHFIDCLVETPGIWAKESSIKLRNICALLSIKGQYHAGPLAFDIGCTDDDHCAVPNQTGASASVIQISEFRLAGGATYTGPGGNTSCRLFKMTNAICQGSINFGQGNQFAGKFFEFGPEIISTGSGKTFWNISNVRVDDDVGTLADVAIIDPSIAAKVHFTNLWGSYRNVLLA